MKTEAGFAMVDTLVALFAATLMITGIFSLHGVMLASTRQAGERLTAAILATALASDGNALTGSSGQVSASGQDFVWTREDTCPDRRPSDRIRQCIRSIQIKWNHKAQERRLDVTTVTLRVLDNA